MDRAAIIAKFGGDYRATDLSYKMGIDHRFADHLASHFVRRVVLETCTGAGFTTIALARYAEHVFTVEIDARRMEEARYNVSLAGVARKVTFIRDDVFRLRLESLSPRIDSSFMDPDWADADGHHACRFRGSTTRPPSDELLDHMLRRTADVALIQPPRIGSREFEGLRDHEEERLYLNGNHELYCLYFGALARTTGKTEFRI